jgi:hypothetical protein
VYFLGAYCAVSPLQQLFSSFSIDDVDAVPFEAMKEKILSKWISLDAQGEFLPEHLTICTE